MLNIHFFLHLRCQPQLHGIGQFIQSGQDILFIDHDPAESQDEHGDGIDIKGEGIGIAVGLDRGSGLIAVVEGEGQVVAQFGEHPADARFEETECQAQERGKG